MSAHIKKISSNTASVCVILYLSYIVISTTSSARLVISCFQRVPNLSRDSQPQRFIKGYNDGIRKTTVPVFGNEKSGKPTRENHSVLFVLGGPPMEDINNFDEYNSKTKKSSKFDTALAIVPPLEDWDRLQRARHYARDPTFLEWPPAIRLFHPFDKSPDIAFDVAQLIEDIELEAFQITLDSWVIIPNIEEAQIEWEKQEVLPDVLDATENYYERLNYEADKRVQDLINDEERKGKIKALKKNANGMTTQQKQTDFEENPSNTKTRGKKSTKEIREEQKKMMEDDFGGPCLLCLEPNEESKERLLELREVLQEGMGLSSYSSPSSIYTWDFVEYIDMGFRPLIPISKFDSFQIAMDVARRLKGLFGDPLTIDVKCLEILSCNSQDSNDNFDDSNQEEWENFQFNSDRFSQQAYQIESDKESWGCNAKIMLMGEEIRQDDEKNEKMINELLEKGEIGGGDISLDYTILDDEEESVTDIEKWLDEDDDFDEGTQIVIGRTHFFTGDQRSYKGMPATSVVDAKDRSLGEAGSVSGLARRRGSTSRKQNVWEDGEYGRRNKDFLPWGMRERKEKEKFIWNDEDQ